MEGDRGATLIIQAAARGVVDFSKADILGREWWLKLSWLLDEVERSDVVQMQTLRHARHVSCLSYGMDEKVFDYHWKAAEECSASVYSQLFPWLKPEGGEKAADGKQIKDIWKGVYGDPNDEDTKRRIMRYREYLQKKLTDGESKQSRAEVRKAKFARPKKGGRDDVLWHAD